MEKQFKKKITWVIKNFSSLQSLKIYSDNFIVDGCKWHLLAYPKGNNVVDHLSLYLEVANYGALPHGWRRHAKFSFTIVNQLSEKLSRQCGDELQQWFQHISPNWGRTTMFPLKELNAKDSGLLVNGELKIVVKIDVLEVVGKLDDSEETSTIIETVDVNGFQLLPLQVRFVSRMFERHAEFASELRPKNPNLRTAYMSFLISLIETMCQSPQKLSKDDMCEAYVALGSMTDVGFKVDWLEKKLDDVLERKEKEHVSETRLQVMEEELKELKQKCSKMEDLVEKEKEEVLAAKTPLSFDDMV